MPEADQLSLASPGADIESRRVRRLFGRPERLAESEFLRKEISARMQERLALIKITPAAILDAGCGDGRDSLALLTKFDQAQWLGVDASAAMLKIAQARQRGAASMLRRLWAGVVPAVAGGRARFAASDFGALPLAASAIDMIWSNLALHWHASPDAVIAEWHRVLRTDGLLMFSCFGPDTFREVRAASSDASARVMSFVDMHDLGDMLINAGFSTPVMDMETITVTYETAGRLLADLRAWGGNPRAAQSRGLTGKHAWQQFIGRLEAFRREDGRIPLTFEVVYGHAFKPAPRRNAAGESIVRFDLQRTKR